MNAGTFVWYELATTDVAAAAQFYGSVVGWSVEAVPEMSYTLFKIGEARAGGAMALMPHLREAGISPHWNGYIAVDDVDGSTATSQQLGATLRFGPQDIPNVGRFAVMTDPDGAPFFLFKGAGEPPPEPPFMSPGRVGWHELHARDHAAELRFYGQMFGWTVSRSLSMGPMGTYEIFAYGGADRGGMMNNPSAPPHWLFYFVVEGIDAAIKRVGEQGGTVLRGPDEVPGGAWVIVARDPQGAEFALVSGTR